MICCWMTEFSHGRERKGMHLLDRDHTKPQPSSPLHESSCWPLVFRAAWEHSWQKEEWPFYSPTLPPPPGTLPTQSFSWCSQWLRSSHKDLPGCLGPQCMFSVTSLWMNELAGGTSPGLECCPQLLPSSTQYYSIYGNNSIHDSPRSL